MVGSPHSCQYKFLIRLEVQTGILWMHDLDESVQFRLVKLLLMMLLNTVIVLQLLVVVVGYFG